MSLMSWNLRAMGGLLLFPFHAFGAGAPNVDLQVIYGDDNRLDLYDVADSRWVALADSTVAIMDSGKLTARGPFTEIQLKSYSAEYKLCAEEPFFEQSTAAFCSGSLVGPDLVLTAGHCLSAERCADVSLVFGFANQERGQLSPSTLITQNVYRCQEVVAREETNSGVDYALVRLDRKVVGHAPLPINRSPPVETGTEIVVIGHPAGLPTKVAAGASVRTVGENLFVANLDTYGGNSGSSVFNARTGLIEGILVSGETDFIWDRERSCRVSNRCGDSSCEGEDVVLISEVAAQIPELGIGLAFSF